MNWLSEVKKSSLFYQHVIIANMLHIMFDMKTVVT